MKRVLILYCWAGVGHYREAKAIYDELKDQGFHVEINDPNEILKESKRIGANFFVLFHYFCNYVVFKGFMTFFTYLQSDVDQHTSSKENKIERRIIDFYKCIQLFIGEFYSDLFLFENYDYIIATYPAAGGIAIGVKRKKRLANLKVINVFPDEAYGMAPYFYAYPDTKIFINSDHVKKACTNMKINNPLAIIGHPLDPEIYKKREEIYKRVQKSLKEGKLNIGLYLGGFAPRKQRNDILNFIKEAKDLIKNNHIKVYVFTNNFRVFNNKVKKLLDDLCLDKNIYVYKTNDLKENIRLGHEWMLKEINIMASRPSELVFYSLATGIPHILFSPIGGQEVSMHKLLRKYANVRDYNNIQNKLTDYLSNKDELIKVSKDLYNNNYKLDGSFEIAKYLKEN